MVCEHVKFIDHTSLFKISQGSPGPKGAKGNTGTRGNSGSQVCILISRVLLIVNVNHPFSTAICYLAICYFFNEMKSKKNAA